MSTHATGHWKVQKANPGAGARWGVGALALPKPCLGVGRGQEQRNQPSAAPKPSGLHPNPPVTSKGCSPAQLSPHPKH